MADNKKGRDKQARDADRRQRERDIVAELEREDETEPPVDERELGAFESELESVAFPATGSEVVEAAGDRSVESVEQSYAIEDLVPDTDVETFESPASVRIRVQRPTVAAAMKRTVEASDMLHNVEIGASQRQAYEKTLRELSAIDADDDEGVTVISDWIVDRIRDDDQLPGSRAVRREAAKFCRANGYEVRNDEWLGI